MAYTKFSAALPAPVHPQAKPGYGKRSAPDQGPRGEHDFAHLRTREAALGAYIDRLPEGALIGYKALAANVADYGQQACGKALNFLSDAGHLRLIKEHLQVADNTFRWVTHTYWSRTARDEEWWKAFVQGLRGIDLTERERRLRAAAETALPATQPQPASDRMPAPGAVVEPGPDSAPGSWPDADRGSEPDGAWEPWPEWEPEAAGEWEALSPHAPEAASAMGVSQGTCGPGVAYIAPSVPPERSAPAATSAPSEAYRVLSRLGRTEPRMTLSAAECAALESLAARWLAWGATPDHLTRSLTEGLPHPLHSPGAIARTRLENKMPPEPIEERAYVTAAFMVCMTCEVPDNVAVLIRGVCLDCREEMQAYDVAEEAGVVIDRVPDTFRRIPAQVDVARRADELRAAAGLRARPVPQPTHGALTRAYSAERAVKPSP